MCSSDLGLIWRDGEVRAGEGHRGGEFRGGEVDAEQGDRRARRHEVYPQRAEGEWGLVPPSPSPMPMGFLDL